jgi:hypothetical protein
MVADPDAKVQQKIESESASNYSKIVDENGEIFFDAFRIL